MKTIVHVWQYQHSTFKGSYWGIGDLLRGVIGLRHFCLKNNYKYILDIHRHKLSHFLKYSNNTYWEASDRLGDTIPFIDNIYAINKYINSSTDDVIFMNTNACETLAIQSEEAKAFIRDILELKEEYMTEFTETYLLPKPYTLLHYRLGDIGIVNGIDNNNYEQLTKNILLHANSNTGLITDNQFLKDNAVLPGVTVPKTTSLGHVGLESTSLDSMKSTLFDLMLCCSANKIKSYSVYPWESGFVFWACQAYNIPFEKIALI